MAFITKKHLSRRTFLKGAGVVVALPLLDSMVPASTALAQTAANPRTRFGAIYFPHGATMDKWTPAKDGSNFEFSEILQPLEPFRSQVNIISDLSHPMAYGSGSEGVVVEVATGKQVARLRGNTRTCHHLAFSGGDANAARAGTGLDVLLQIAGIECHLNIEDADLLQRTIEQDDVGGASRLALDVDQVVA